MSFLPAHSFIQLRADGVSIVFARFDAGLPAVLHWGADLGALSDDELQSLLVAASRQSGGTLDAAWYAPLLPQESDGWSGRPGVLLSRPGAPVFPRWRVTSLDAHERSLRITADDEDAGVVFSATLAIAAGGLVTADYSIGNTGADGLEVHQLEPTLPVPRRGRSTTDVTGRWTREKAPHTAPALRGTWTRQSRRGRGGHDSPWALIAADTDRPANRSGEVWITHVGWSADTTYRWDRGPDAAALLGAGELLRPTEVVLAGGAEYAAPTTYFAWSDAGLDGASARFHTHLRARPHHPHTRRPLVLNTWEAVYFDHDPDRLLALADLAASLGIERFVLDDGWFHDRRDDSRGLGDWVVDPAVWPHGLGPLARRVHELGMEFGLWFEPEMVNLDSDLARAHPHWLLHNPAHLEHDPRLNWRTQYVLDLGVAEAYEHVRGQIDALVTELGIDFIKWDHNRDLIEPVHAGRPGTHGQTRAAYRLIAELKRAHPGLEIESCSSGGARSDLGILQVTDRVWASDSNDPIERQDIQRWTNLLLPPELVGGHVGPTTAHSSGRTTDLSFRMATSLLASAGFEWHLGETDDAQREVIRRFAALYREVRPLVHTGTLVHPDTTDPALRITGVVSPDRADAVFVVATVATLEDAQPEQLRLAGLDDDRSYRVRVRDDVGLPSLGFAVPEWVVTETTLPGRVLATYGLQLPKLWPAQALIVQATAVS
ncbi:alpha-galactosidase [soil metagenome]